MNRSQPSRRYRSASPRREDHHWEGRRQDDYGSSRDVADRHYDRNYDRGTGRDGTRDGKRTREDDPFEKDRRSQVKSRGEKVVGGIRYKGDAKPREKGERSRDESRRKERNQSYNDDGQGAIENKKEEERRKEKKEKKRKVEQPAEVMIKVTVNDRLGTKAQIPCYGSDNIGKAALICY